MVMDSDEEDFVFYGTPIEREEDVSSRKKKALAEASGNLRSLPAWKQEVRDEEGRRRFHGAFTGGFAAGYYNTVGSKEGWAPQSFTSSRKSRAEVKEQSILNFLDEDEKAELEGRSLATSSQFDTFGFTAAELARKQAETEQQHRQSAIPGPVPDELILPVTESIGVRLLKKMGWRHGHSIKDSQTKSLYDARREARKAFLAFTSDETNAQPESEPINGDFGDLQELPADTGSESSKSTPVYVLNPKQDLHGLGFDPYKHAPEFRERKRLCTSGGREHAYGRVTKDNFSKSRNIAPGFGIGALEELDAEDEDVYASGYDFGSFVEEVEEPSRPSLDFQDRPRLTEKGNGILPGFRLASNSDYQFQRFDPPIIPKDFDPRHKFSGPLETDRSLYDPPPPESPPPEDSNLKLLIEGVAALVARCGKLFEDLSREKNQSNPLFSFLYGGDFCGYYERRLWEEKQKRNQSKPSREGKFSVDVPKMTAESRGKILGERPLGRSATTPSSSVVPADVKFQSDLSETFTKPSVLSDILEVSKPFRDDPAKQERFEQYLKEKYYGGLRSTESSGTNKMSESARARERLDFEAAAEAIEKGRWRKEFMEGSVESSSTGGVQFTSGGIEQVKSSKDEDLMTKKLYPKREEFQWRPSPILCKRFDLIDPYMGKPPPAPRVRSKMDSLFFIPDTVKLTKVEESAVTSTDTLSVPLDNQQSNDIDEKMSEDKVEVESVGRPVDLYKAIFSDDSDEEKETSIVKNVENPDKKVQAANATLNRLIAGDFLESLGKELGLEVPADRPISSNQDRSPSEKEIAHARNGDISILPVHDRSSAVPQRISQNIELPKDRETAGEGLQPRENKIVSGGPMGDGKDANDKLSEGRPVKIHVDYLPQDHGNSKAVTKSRGNRSPLSSEDEKIRKSSRRRHYRSDSESDSSSDHRDQYHSSSKEKRRESRREKRHRRKKHCRHGNKDSPEKSSRRRSEKDRADVKRERVR
ncbi:hypothetical protein BT93_K0157 [Corymbia citriodora subsp. variegata]|nr:hypothetical protein BT93_K0157 [Corymbia citriodora subsp. variegata]